MERPPICLLCGHLRAQAAPRTLCPRCRARQPEGEWISEDGKTDSEKITDPLFAWGFGLGLGWLSLKVARYAVRPPFGFSSVMLLVGCVLMLVVAGLSLHRGGEIAFVRSGRFTSTDGRLTAHVRFFAGRLRWLVSRRAVLHRLDLAAVSVAKDARALTSLDARASVRALRGLFEGDRSLRAWAFVTDDAVVAVAAILGMAARDELDVLVGEGSAFCFEHGRVRSAAPGEHRLWLRAPHDAAPAHPFERALLDHVRALAPLLPGVPPPTISPSGYRESPREAGDEAASVEFPQVVERFASSSRLRARDMLAQLRLSAPIEVGRGGDEALVAAFLAAARVEPEATRALAVGVNRALTEVATVQLTPLAALTPDALRELLGSLDEVEVPEKLRAPAPRPVELFTGKGYLSQQAYRDRYLPLLVHGRVARAVCVWHQSTGDADGIDTAYQYAWLDHLGRLQRAHGRDSYDPMHAAHGSGKGQMVVDMDASMHRGRVLTVVYDDQGAHVVYEALCIDKAG